MNIFSGNGTSAESAGEGTQFEAMAPPASASPAPEAIQRQMTVSARSDIEPYLPEEVKSYQPQAVAPRQEMPEGALIIGYYKKRFDYWPLIVGGGALLLMGIASMFAKSKS